MEPETGLRFLVLGVMVLQPASNILNVLGEPSPALGGLSGADLLPPRHLHCQAAQPLGERIGGGGDQVTHGGQLIVRRRLVVILAQAHGGNIRRVAVKQVLILGADLFKVILKLTEPEKNEFCTFLKFLEPVMKRPGHRLKS